MSQAMKKKFPSLASIDTDGNTSFLRAARNGQLDKVLEHLKSNIDINTSNANGLNALHLASKDGHVEIVAELLKRGARVDAATKKGNTALHIASLAGQEEVVKLLVSHGASVNVQSQNGFTPLYMAAQENHDNVVKFLLANGANQSLSTEDGFTPLAVAMQQGHDKVVTVLLENDTRGKVRLPALHIAAKKDDVKAAKLLLENEHNPDVTSKSGFTPLHIASHYGNQSIANLLIQKGADVNYSAKHNITPLHVAAKWGKTNMVTVLLVQGANIESKTRDGLTPLHCAARSGHEQVVDMLLDKGAPISSKTKNGLAPLHMAAQGDHVDAARILLYHRAPVDEVTVDYLTALHVAAHCGHVRVAKLLLDRQADANARALNGFTPLHIACKKNRIKVVELLLKHGANISATTESGLTPLHVASFMGCMNIVIYLLQHDANPDVPTVRGETPLHLAARANQTDIIRILLRNGAQVDARAREQQTPLHIASRLGNVDIVMLLLQHGAKVDNTTKDMYTALHIAAKEGQDEVAAALIDNGASLDAKTKKGFTPLHLAAKYGHLKVAKLLLQKEAPVDAQGKNGVTPLHVASHYDHQNVALLLLEKGASPYATAKNGHTPLHIAAKKNQMDIANTLLEYGAKPNAESKAGFTPLHLSSQEGHTDMSDLLIEHKADVNYNAKNGLTPLHLCAQEDKVAVAQTLVKNGAEVDASTKNGYTPLHIACHYGQVNMVKFLLANGADVGAMTALGYTPLHQAAQQGHTNIVNVLLENSAQPDAMTKSGQTPLHIAQKLGYITVIDTLKVVTAPCSPMTASTGSVGEEKYRVVAPEAMQETFMSDSEEEGGEDTVLGDHTYRYLTADEMKSLGDDSLPIDVTRDERIDSNRIAGHIDMLPPQHIEDTISPEHIHQNYIEYIKKYTPDNIDINKHPINIGFLVSFLVDARGGAMRGCRHSGVRVIVPPRCASSPTRITCRYVRPQRTPHPPPLMEGEALASRVLELGPVGAKFLGPVIIEVPHFAALRGKEREIVILRSDNGENWKEHTVDATEEVLNEVLHDSFETEDLNQMEDVSSGRITRIVTQDFPQYFAVVSRIRQEVHAIGPEGGMVSSTVVPQVQAVFPQGALTKKIKVGLQAQPIDPELTAKLLGHSVAVSPVVTVEPRRRKFHKAITLSMPAPRAHSQGMINEYSGNAPTLRLLCSITGGTTRAQWEDVTGSTPLTFVNDCVSFTTTVSARFWLMDCRNVEDATKMATELYKEAIHVPFMAKFVVFAKRVDPLEARLRVFCMTDDKEDKTLEHQEHFTEVAKSRDVEVLEGKPQFIEFAGNLVPITKSGEQLQFKFRAFRENRLPFSVRVKDQHAEAVSRCLFMKEPKLPKGEPPQQPICILNIVLPDDIVVDTISLTDSDSIKKQMYANESFDYYRPDPRLADMSNLLGDDWVPLATQLGLTPSEINVIKSEYPDSVAKQAQSMLRMWLSQSGNKAQTNMLESALKRIGREDIIPQCLNVDYGMIGKQRLITSIEDKEARHRDKYSAEEKQVESSEEEEDFNKTVTERRQQIEERLSVDRTVPASSQRVEIVQEITSIKRQSLVENKIAEVEQKAVTISEPVAAKTTTVTTGTTTISAVSRQDQRRDSDLLEGVTQRLETTKTITTISSNEDPNSPKFSKTPPPSPADFIIKEQTAPIQEWDVGKESPLQREPQISPKDAEQQGFSTTTERLVASNEEKLLDKPLGQTLTGLSVIDDHIVIDLETVLNQTNAFIQSESQPEPYDAFTEKYSKKEPVNERKIDDNKNNMNEKKKSKKGFFGSIKTFVERSFESDSESEKSPKKSRKPKKDTKTKKAKDEATLPPKKPKLPTPPLEPSDLDTIPYVESSPSDLAPVYRPLEQGDEPPPYNPPDIPSDPITEAEATETLELQPEQQSPKKKSKVKTKPVPEVQEIPQLKPEQKSPKKKPKIKTVVVEEVTKTIEPLVIEAEEFSIIVDPSNKESPKKSKETFTINIDESIEKIEKEILEKSPILPEEKIVKPWADLDLESDIPPVRPIRYKEHVYEDIEGGSVISIPSDQVKNITTDMIRNEINFGGWVDDKQKVTIDPKPAELIIQKHDKEVLREKEPDSKKKDDKKSGFFGLFKKKDSKKEEEIDRPALSDAVLKHIEDSKKFLKGEVEDYHDVRPAPISQECLAKTMSLDREKAPIQEKVKRTASLEREKKKDRELSPIPSGLFGIFKKSKKEDSKALILSQAVLKDMDDTKQFLKDEVDNYHDVKPLSPSHTDVKLEKHSTDLKESSPKPSGIFEIFKKGKKDEEVSKPVSSEAAVFDMENTKNFLSKEVDKYHDVKPEKFEAIESPPIEKVSDEARESSPKPSALFGIFKKTKKEDKALSKPVLSEAAINQINDTKNFLFQEVKKYHDVKPEKFEQIVEGPIKEEVTSPKHSSLFGMFKKTNKDREEIKSTLSEAVLKDMNDTKQFLGTEIEKHDDVKPIKFEPVLEATAVRTVEENKESSPKSAGLLGIFKISKKEEDKDRKFDLSEATMKQISDTCKFLSNEVEIYHDVKPSKFEPVETVIEKIDEDVQEAKTSGMFGIFKKSKKDEKAKSLDESVVKQIEDTDKFLPDDTTVEICEAVKGEIVQKSLNEKIEASPKHSGLFSIFKKSKKEDESNTTPLSEAVQKSIDETNEFLASEVAKYHDVKPITMEEITITKVVDDVESSSKPSRGLFGLLKKSKESPEKRTFSEQALKDINDAYQFIHDEVEHYEDVKPAKFEPIIEEKPLKATEEVQQASPKPTRGILGLFKKSSRESPEKKPSLPEPVLKDMDETVAQDQTVKEVAESREISKGVFGLFKKSREESPVKKIELSEGVQQDIADTNQFLVVEIENYNDVKPKVFMRLEGRPLESSPKPSRGLFGIFKRSKTEDGEEALHDALEEKVGKKLKDDLESSPKPARGLFGIFKKGTRDEDEDQQIEVKPSLSEVAIEEMNMTRQFLIDEIANYNDVKPAKFPTVIEEKSQSSPKPSHGLFDLFKKSKKDDEEPSQLSESVLKDMSDTHDFIKDEIDNYHDAKPTEGFFGLFKKSKKDEEELTKTQSIPADEAKLENEVVKYDEKVIEKETVGFLAKFKWRGKSGSQEPEFSEEAQQSFEDTKNFIYTELCHYDDGKMGKAKKEDKVVTFDDSVVERAKVKIVSEAQISVVDPLTHLTEDVKETAKDAVLTMKRIPEETEKYVKDKSGKDKKGFFNIFGKKSKSQDGSLEDSKGRSEDESDESPKKQKRRKSSSPFKIFEKSRKSDEDERNLPENKIKEAESIKDELLAVEFEHEEPSIGLSEEVLSSLDKKMQELKNYSKEAIKEMDDCRDFLFIELDNYDNGKPVLVTDIDKGLENGISPEDAAREIDDIIDMATRVAEGTADISNKEMRKSGGFFNKIGNLISSTPEKTEEVKETFAEVADKAHDLNVDTKETLIGKKELLRHESDNVKDVTLDIITDLKQSTEEAATKTKESLEEAAAKANESTIQATAKTRNKAVDAVKGASEQIGDISDEVAEVIKYKSKKAKKKAGSFFSKMGNILTGTADDVKKESKEIKEEATQALDETGENLEAAKIKAERVSQEIVEDIIKVVDETEKATRETLTGLEREGEDVMYDAEIEESEKVDDMKVTKDKAIDFAAEQLEGVKAAEVQIVESSVDKMEKLGKSFNKDIEVSAGVVKDKSKKTKRKSAGFFSKMGNLISGSADEIKKDHKDEEEVVSDKVDSATEVLNNLEKELKISIDDRDDVSKEDDGKKRLEEIEDKVFKVSKEVQDATAKNIEDIRGATSDFLQKTSESVQEHGTKLEREVSHVSSDAQKAAADSIESAKEKGKKAKKKSTGFLSKMGNLISGPGEEAKKEMKDFKESEKSIIQAVEKTVEKTDKPSEATKSKTETVKDDVQRTAKVATEELDKSAEVIDIVRADLDIMKEATDDKVDDVKETSDRCLEKAKDTSGSTIEQNKSDTITKDVTDKIVDDNDAIDSTKEERKKTKKKVGGFLSKVGNLISGAAEDTKKEFYDAQDTSVKAVDKKVEDISESLQATAEVAQDAAEDIIDKIKDTACNNPNEVTEHVKSTKKDMQGESEELITDIRGTAKDTADEILLGVQKIQEDIKEAVENLHATQDEAFHSKQGIIDQSSKKIQEPAKPLAEAAQGMIQEASDLSKDIKETAHYIGKKSANEFDKTKRNVDDVFSSIKDESEEALDKAKQKRKKSKKKSVGFFSKMGNLISGAAEDTKKELKDVEGANVKAVEGKVEQAKIVAEDSLTKLEEVNEAAKKKVCEVEEGTKEITADIARRTFKKADDIKEGVKDVMYKTENNLIEAKDTTLETVDTAKEKTKEMKDQAAKFVKDTKDITLQKTEAAIAATEEKTLEFTEKVLSCVEDGSKDTKGKAFEEIQIAKDQILDIKDQVLDVGHDVMTKTKDGLEAAGDKTAEVLTSAKDELTDVRDKLVENAEEKLEATEDFIVVLKDNISESRKTVGDQIGVVTEKVVDKTEEALDLTKKELLDLEDNSKETIIGGIEVTRDTIHKVVEESKGGLKETKKKVIDSSHEMMHNAEETIQLAKEALTDAKGQEALALAKDRLAELAESAGKKTSTLHSTKDTAYEETDSEIRLAQGTTSDVEVKIKEGVFLKREFSETAQNTFVDVEDEGKKGTENLVEDLKEKGKKAKKKSGGFFTKMGNLISGTAEDTKREINELKESSERIVSEKMDDTKNMTDESKSCVKKALDDLDKETQIDKSASNKSGEEISRDKDWLATESAKIGDEKNETFDGANTAMYEASEGAKEKGKKYRKKSTGFLSKMGSLISGSTDEAKKNLNAAQHEIQKTLDTAVESENSLSVSASSGVKDEAAVFIKKETEQLDMTIDSAKKATKEALHDLDQSKDETFESTIKKIDDINETADKKIKELEKSKSQLVEGSLSKAEDLKGVEEVSKDKGKRARKRSTGFLSKVGNLIAGSTDEAKKDIKNTKDNLERDVKDSKKAVTEKIEDIDQAVKLKLDQVKCVTQSFIHQESIPSEAALSGAQQTVVHLGKEAKKVVEEVKEVSSNIVDKSRSQIESEDVKIETKISGVKESFGEVKEKEDTAKEKSGDVFPKPISSTKQDIKDLTKKVVDESIQKVEIDISELKTTTGETIKDSTSKKNEEVNREIADSASEVKSGAAKSVEVGKEKPKKVKEKSGGFFTKMGTLLSGAADESKKEIQKVETSAEKMISQESDKLKSDIVNITEKIEGESSKTVKSIQQQEVQVIEKDVKEGALEKVEPVAKQTSEEIKKVDESKKVASKSADDLLEKTSMRDLSSIEVVKSKAQKEFEDLDKEIDNAREQTQEALSNIYATREDLRYIEGDVKKGAKVKKESIKLTESSGKATNGVASQAEKLKSYVTSPTMARRAESQRYAKDERPTVREITSSKSEDFTDENLYTVTEPDDETVSDSGSKRKPLFHLESEEDDSLESVLQSEKDRRESAKSNVLETLTETKLDTLLSNLETQMVKDLKEALPDDKPKFETKVAQAEKELEDITKDSQADVEHIEQKLRDLDKALDSLEQASDPKLEKRLHRVERKFEHMASEVMEKDSNSEVSPNEVEYRREHEFQRLVSQLSTEEVSDFQKEYSHLWDETTFSKSEEWDSKTPDSQVDVQELPQGEASGVASVSSHHESPLKVEGEEVASSQHHLATQQRQVADQHQLSEEMKQLLKELEQESKQ